MINIKITRTKTVHCDLKKHAISLKICIPAPFMSISRFACMQKYDFSYPLYAINELKIYFEVYTTTVLIGMS